ncbi:hybrid sensor histidine kinase/response regulator transcription factor [Reichenbachiella versicolor]|uniref:hybrid sensor histidine kinase/response regulator transcription factor n=1 Tax=Reichenbachiella versicolor TaxID=1821036 RepID=UPI000D6E4927|nr:hybrid sensor histidine kinase/response regulator transcription factor [Reichenbachiella versicolor]
MNTYLNQLNSWQRTAFYYFYIYRSTRGLNIRHCTYGLLLSVFLTVSLQAQNVKFDHLDIKDGLSQKNVFSMKFDSRGNLWVGTLNGLNKYNGYSFEVFKPNLSDSNSITSNSVKALASGIDGNMWVYTIDGGIDRYNASEYRFEHVTDSIFKGINLDLMTDMTFSNHCLWILIGKRILAYDTEKKAISRLRSSVNWRGIFSLNSQIFIFGNEGLYRLEINNHKIIKKLLLKESIYGASVQKGQIHLLTKNDLINFNVSRNETKIILQNHKISTSVSSQSSIPIVLTDQHVWAKQNFNLARQALDGTGSIESFKHNPSDPNSFTGHYVSHILTDQNQNIWIGTQKHGLNYFGHSKNQFEHISWDYSQDQTKAIDPIRAICKTTNGDLWLGFDRTGIGIIHSDGTQSSIDSYLGSDGNKKKLLSVRAIFQDALGNIWVGSMRGISKFDQRKKRLVHISNILEDGWNKRTYAFEQLNESEIILSNASKIARFNVLTGEQKVFNYEDKLNINITIRDIELDDQKNYWLALDNKGIVFVNAEMDSAYHWSADKIDISDDKVYNLKFLNGYLWIATNSGLNKLNLSNMVVEAKYFEEDGLANNVVYSVDADEQGRIWTSSNWGISVLDTNTEQFTSYLTDRFFMDDASSRDEAGNFYFGGYSGTVSFDPNSISNQKSIKRLSLESFSVLDQIITPSSNLLEHNINQSKSIKLDYTQNTFSFKVGVTPFDLPNNDQIRYMLRGWNKDWQLVDNNQRVVSFTNVSPGQYKLLIQVSSNKENWESTKELQLVITPPFWEETWFKIAILVFVILLIVAFVRYRIHQIEIQNKLLSQKVDEQTKDLRIKNEEIQKISEQLHEADQAKLRFFTNVSHEFRTPLTVILGYLDGLDQDNSKKTRGIIRNNAIRLLRLIDQVIEFRKIDLQQAKLSVSEINPSKFTEDIVKSFQILADKKGINLEYENKTIPSLWSDPDKLDKVLYNLISNAIKYTPRDKVVSVSIEASDSTIDFIVKDEGLGIQESDLKSIFDRFYRSDSQHQQMADGHGIGLSLVNELVEMMHGVIDVQSTVNEGTCFIVSFKKGKQHFDEADFGGSSAKISLPTEVENQPSIDSLSVKEYSILIVEDNLDLREYLISILSPNYQVISAEHGKEGIEALDHHLPDLIISDIMMPEMNGIEFCQAVKDEIMTSHIPIILLTAKTDNRSKIEGFELGIDDYIEKPFDKKLFLTRVRSLLDNRKAFKQQLITVQASDNIDQTKISKRDLDFWKNANHIMKQGISDTNLTMESIAEQLYMSRSTFYRKFKSLTGENAADYFRKMRLQVAADLIKDGHDTISTISAQVGFDSVEQFRNKFKEQFGMTPSEFRK